MTEENQAQDDSTRPKYPEPTGFCYCCGCIVKQPALFCDETCQQDQEAGLCGVIET